MKIKNFIKNNKILIIYSIILILFIILFSQIQENFLTVRNIKNLLRHTTRNAFAALGLTFVIIVGYNDLSFGLIGCLSAMTASFLIASGQDPIISIVIGLILGSFWGFLNGYIIAKYKLPDMVVTIGSGAIAFGLSYLYSKGAFIYDNFLTSGILELNDKLVFGIPLPVILLIIVFIICFYFLNKTVFGRKFYATGENIIAATYSGINVRVFIIVAFILSALLGSLSTIIETAAQGYGNVKTGTILLLPSYATVYLGMAILKKPTIIGSLIASIFISIILNGLTLINMPFYVSNLILSLILLVALVLSKASFSFKQKNLGKA